MAEKQKEEEGQTPANPPPGVMQVSEDGSGHMNAHSKLRVKFNGKNLVVSLLMQEDDIAPLFDGAAWAGTQLWDAAIVAVTYVYKTYHEEILQGIKLIELGCGTGVPGMCCRTMGAEVLLTEQNVDENFADDAGIRVEVLSWDRERSKEVMKKNGTFDMILVCDCVFPPVYGDSWRPLADSVHVLLQGEALLEGDAAKAKMKGGRVAVFSVERRRGDKMEEFLSYVDALEPKIERTEVLTDDKITIYEMRMRKA